MWWWLVPGVLVAALLPAPSSAISAGSGKTPIPKAQVCDRFASPRGSDSARGTQKHPFRSAQRLLRSLAKGQTGCLRGGTYTSSAEHVLAFNRSDATIRSFPGERARLVGLVTVLRGANRDRLKAVIVEGNGRRDTVRVHAADFILEDSVITNDWRGWSCMLLGTHADGPAIRPIIRRNRFHECGSLAAGNKEHGIYAAYVFDGLITQNVFYNVAAWAIQLYPGAQRTIVSRNVIDGGAPSVRGGIVFGAESDPSPSSDNIVEHNVVAYATTYNIAESWGGPPGKGNIARSNCVFGAGAGDIGDDMSVAVSGNLVADPLFVNRAKRDYRLRAASGCRAVLGGNVSDFP